MLKETRNLIIFFVVTYLLTWACYTPIALSGNSPYDMPWMILLILGGAGPSIVGVLMVLFTYDKEQRRDFWRRCFSCKRISPLWWAVIFLIFPLIYAVIVALDLATGGSLPAMEQLKSLMANPIMWPLAAFISFMSGPWSEEFGWRGYAMDPIIKRFGAITGSVVLGVIWAFWHLPLFFMPATWHGKIGFGLTGLWMFVAYSIGLASIMTWVYLSTNRSILSGMLMHFTSNFTAQLMAPSAEHVEVMRAVAVIVVGVVVMAWMVRRSKPQSLQPAQTGQAI